MSSRKRKNGTYSILTYDIPEQAGFQNPSDELRVCAIRMNLSTWVIPTAYIPWDLIDRMKTAKIKHRLHKFDNDEEESIRQEAKEELELETARIHGSLIKALDKATTAYNEAKTELEAKTTASPNEWTECVMHWEKRSRVALERAATHLNAAVLCAELFDQTMEVKDVLEGLRETITSQQATYEAQTTELRTTYNITVQSTQGKRRGPRQELYGESITGILRWMGSQGWTKEDAKAVLAARSMGDYSNTTIALQIGDGKSGKCRYGTIPELADNVIEALNQDRTDALAVVEG